MQDPNTILIEDAGFSTRTENGLLNCNFKTLGDIVDMTDVEMLRNPNFGKKSLKDMKDVLAKHGFVYEPVSIRLTKAMQGAAKIGGMTETEYARLALMLHLDKICHFNTVKYRYVLKEPKLNVIETWATSPHKKAVEVMKALDPDWQPPKEPKS